MYKQSSLFSSIILLLLATSAIADVPLGLPKPLIPKDNPQSSAKKELGKRLFFLISA